MSDTEQTLWKVSADGAQTMLLWGSRYKTSEAKVVAKYRRLLLNQRVPVELGKQAKIEAHLCICPGPCWTLADAIVSADHLENVPKEWWFFGHVETDGKTPVTTVCPMCSKHARRYRKTLGERLARIEERIDELDGDIDRLEDES